MHDFDISIPKINVDHTEVNHSQSVDMNVHIESEKEENDDN